MGVEGYDFKKIWSIFSFKKIFGGGIVEAKLIFGFF